MRTNGFASRCFICALANWVAILPARADDWVTAVSALIKMRPGNLPSGSASVSISAARGECAGIQIVAQPPADSVDASPTDLAGPGAPITPKLYREGWMNVVYPTVQGDPGLWPDPLIPVTDSYVGERRNALPWSSTADRPLVLYLELCVPANQSPGTYQGEIQLTARDRPRATVPVTLEVQPFQLPVTSSLPTTFGISVLSIAYRHNLDPRSPAAMALLQNYGRSLLAHRLSPHGMSFLAPNTTFVGDEAVVDFTSYDQEMGPFLDGTALASGAKFSTAEVRELPEEGPQPNNAQRISYYRAFRNHFRERGWSAKLIYYTSLMDEPEITPNHDERIAAVHARSNLLRQAQGISVMIADAVYDDLMGYFDILSTVINCLYSRSGPQSCEPVNSPDRTRQLIGPQAELWHYQSCLTFGCGADTRVPDIREAFSDWASYAIDHSVARNRAMGPLAFMGRIKGELYYSTVQNYNGFYDPWDSMYSWGNPDNVGGANGEGTLFYPGTTSRIGGQSDIPIESLRLKIIRDGLQDYEYLHLLSGLEGTATYAEEAAQRLVQSAYRITSDPTEWARVRADVTTRILELLNPSGARYIMSSLPTELMAGDTATFTVTAVDANGNVRTDYNGTLRIRSSDPQAILPPVQRFVNGIARNIPITLQTAGSQTVIAEDTVYPFSASRRVQVRISAIAGYRISFARQVSAGEPVQFTLRATDQYGNTIPQYSGRARLSSSDRRAEFPGIVTISNGVTSEIAIFKAAGSPSLSATSVLRPTLSGSGTARVVAGPAARYSITALDVSATVARYTTFSVGTVDAYGNPVTNYGGTATVSSSDPNAQIPATTAFFRGIVPNLHVTFQTAGIQTVSLRDRNNPQLVGEGSLRVLGGSAVTFEIVGLPNTTMARAETRFSVVAKDAYQNVASEYAGTVRVTSTDQRARFVLSSFSSGVAQARATFQNEGAHSVVVADSVHGSLRGEASTSVVSTAPLACSVDGPGSPTLLLLLAYAGLWRMRSKSRKR